MIFKTLKGESHCVYLEDILELVSRYNMCLNLAKCSFDVQAGKFPEFVLTRIRIEVNPNKFQAIINMRNRSNIKEVQ